MIGVGGLAAVRSAAKREQLLGKRALYECAVDPVRWWCICTRPGSYGNDICERPVTCVLTKASWPMREPGLDAVPA